jgi:spore maturation protein CgeB
MKPRVLCCYFKDDTMSTDAAAGFERAGAAVCRAVLDPVPGGTVPFDPVSLFEKALSNKTDLFFTINAFGVDPDCDVLRGFSMLEIPAAVWFIDNPFYFPAHLKAIASIPNCHCFPWDRYYIPLLKKFGIRRVHYLPQATAPERFHPFPLAPEERREFEHPLAFAGNLDLFPMQQRIDAWLESRPAWRERFFPFLEKATETLAQNRGIPTFEVVEALCRTPGFREPGLNDFEVFEMARLVEMNLSIALRREFVRFLEPLGVKVWGERAEWETVVSGDRCLGRVSYFHNMPRVYRGAKINLNYSRVQQRHGTNQRVFDVPACGAFLLTDHREELEELFQPDRDIAFFRDFDELEKKLAFYRDDAARNVLAARARERVLSQHTYAHRMQTLMQTVNREAVKPLYLENPRNARALIWVARALGRKKKVKEALEFLKVAARVAPERTAEIQETIGMICGRPL